MITKLLLVRNERANDAHREEGKGRQLGSEIKCILGLQPREDLISQALVVKGYHAFSVCLSLLYLGGSLGTECRDNKLHGK